MPNWKSPGLDYIHGFWLKRFSSLHRTIADILNNELPNASIPEWMVESRTVLIQKDPTKCNAVGNYRPIACRNLLWKLLTDIITDKLNEHLENQGSVPEEQKGCRRRSHGTKVQLHIDKAVIKNCNRRKTNLNMAWIDFSKVYDMVPHSWTIKSLELVETTKNIVNLLKETMKNWKTKLDCSNTVIGALKINRGIFPGDSPSPLLFIVSLLPLTLLLRKMKQGYSFGKGKSKLHYFLFMDDLKLYGGGQPV